MCPQILSQCCVLFCGDLGAAAGDPCSIHTASERPGLILGLCSRSNTDGSGQSRRKPPPPPPPISLCSVLYLMPVCPQHITTRAEQEGESPPSSLNTLLHSKRDKRKRNPCRGKWSLFVPYAPSGQFVSNVEWCFATVFPHKEDKSFSRLHSYIAAFSHHRKFLESKIVPSVFPNPCLLFEFKHQTGTACHKEIAGGLLEAFRVSDNSLS